MSRMTWDEFKALVDAEIEAEGADGSAELWDIEGCWVPDVSEVDASTPPSLIIRGTKVRVFR